MPFKQSRRGLMRSVAGYVTGFTSLALVDGVEANSESDLEWTANNTMEGDNTVSASLEVGYFGSDLDQRWIDGELKERWRHYLEASFCATDTYQVNNIWGQRFDTRFYNGTEHNGVPTAGSAAWPDPPGGNWGAVLEVVLENAITSLSSIANFGRTAQEVKEAYNEEDFSVKEMDHIEFDANYRHYTRNDCSHSVNFVADQIPDTTGMVDVLSVANDTDIDEVGPYIYIYPDDGNIPEPTHHDTSTASTSGSSGGSDSNTPYMDMFDNMSQGELAQHGVQRIPSSQTAKLGPNRTPSPSDRPTYVTTFEPNIEFGAKNGEIVATDIKEY